MCAFRDSYADFVKAGAVVLGVSADSAETHQGFIASQNLPFKLLTDENDEVRKLFGIPADLFGLLKGRETYVINKAGVVELVYNNQLKPEEHVQETLAVLAA